MTSRHPKALALAALALGACAHAAPASPLSGMEAVEATRAALQRGETEQALAHLTAARTSADPATAAAALELQDEVASRVLDAVAALCAVRKMLPYDAALRLMDRLVALDPSQIGRRDEVQREADRYLWEQFLKFQQEGEALRAQRDWQLRVAPVGFSF